MVGDAQRSAATLPALLEAAVAALPDGVTRPGQVAMAEAVAAALDTGEHLLVQAGTGTGKSLAYLVPALAAGKTVVVSTATLALQSQLVRTDIPRLLDACAPLLGRRPDVVLLKGRGNYLCRLRLEDGVADEQGQQEELAAAPARQSGRLADDVRRLREWATTTDTGDRDDLAPPVSDRAWGLVSVSARDCVGADRCPHAASCFSESARAAARQADVVVTNHALLTLDVATHGRVLPEHDAVVVDEAHELAMKMSDAAAAELTVGHLDRVARRCSGALRGEHGDRLAEATDAFTGWLRGAPAGRLHPLPPVVRELLTLLDAAVRGAGGGLRKASAGEPEDAGARQLQTWLDGISETCQRVAADRDDDVIWVEVPGTGSPLLRVAPLSVAETLAAGLFGTRTVIATSATLTIGGDFRLTAEQLGLAADEPPWRGLDVGSPFDYARQAMLYVAAHLPPPPPGPPGDAVLNELADLVQAAGGRTLALFSSMRGAREAAAALRPGLDLPVLVQGEAPLPQLVAQFRAQPHSCLFGTLSLWQGVDVKGPACQLVVIDRIPFPRPDDPLFSARSEAADRAGRSGFTTVSVAHAAMLLAQGAGRLIRAADDRGVVAVLDSRMATRRYGSFLRASLPPMWPTTDPKIARAALRRLDATAREQAPSEDGLTDTTIAGSM